MSEPSPPPFTLHSSPSTQKALKAYRLIGLPLLLLGLLYLLGPEPGLFGFGTRFGPVWWLTGLTLLGLGGALSTLNWWGAHLSLSKDRATTTLEETP